MPSSTPHSSPKVQLQLEPREQEVLQRLLEFESCRLDPHKGVSRAQELGLRHLDQHDLTIVQDLLDKLRS